MAKASTILAVARSNPGGLSFTEFQRLVEAAGFSLDRVSGSHHIYSKAGIPEIINLQPKGKNAAKTHQVRQVIDLIDRYGIKIS